ncbi:MAG: hypothetical protein K0R17_4025 [Rariglobus sp.]|jgi:hypothetical protein|nr:hypothetical protein [Rariglobus sp.]
MGAPGNESFPVGALSAHRLLSVHSLVNLFPYQS